MTQHLSVTAFAADLAAQKNNPNVRFIDVRTESEYNACHIDGVKNIPLDQLSAQKDSFNGLKALYIHCASGGRSAQALALLPDFSGEVFDFCGGLNAWKSQGYPFICAQKKSAWSWVMGLFRR